MKKIAPLKGDDLLAAILSATGTRDGEVGNRIIDQLSQSLTRPRPRDADGLINAAMGTLAELAPRNVIEAFICVQLAALHESALTFLGEGKLRAADLLMRRFNLQLQTLRKCRGERPV
jgi:hypothetical protein